MAFKLREKLNKNVNKIACKIIGYTSLLTPLEEAKCKECGMDSYA